MISLRWMMQIALRHALIPQLIWLKAADTVSLGTASSRLSQNPWAGIHLYKQFTLEQTSHSALCKCKHFSSVWIRNNFVLEQTMLDDVGVLVCLFLNRSELGFVHSSALLCGSERVSISCYCLDLLCKDTLASFGGTLKSLTCGRHACK